MSTDDIQITARRLQQIGRLVTNAAKTRATNRDRKRVHREGLRRALKMNKAVKATPKQRADFEAKFCASFNHVRFHIQPTGEGFEVWNVESHEICATFPTFSRAKTYVESHS